MPAHIGQQVVYQQGESDSPLTARPDRRYPAVIYDVCEDACHLIVFTHSGNVIATSIAQGSVLSPERCWYYPMSAVAITKEGK